MPIAMPLMSLNQPINNGITAPPDTAMIINPEISLLLAGIFSTAIENTSGKMLATAIPMINTSPHAINADGMIRIATSDAIPRIEVHIKNFLDDMVASIIAPANVPKVRPAK